MYISKSVCSKNAAFSNLLTCMFILAHPILPLTPSCVSVAACIHIHRIYTTRTPHGSRQQVHKVGNSTSLATDTFTLKRSCMQHITGTWMMFSLHSQSWCGNTTRLIISGLGYITRGANYQWGAGLASGRAAPWLIPPACSHTAD